MSPTEGPPQNAYAPPQAHVEDVVDRTDGPVLASRSARFWAAMIDLGIGLAVLLAARWLTPWDPWRAADVSFGVQAINGAIGFAAFLIVHGWLLVNRGQTVGKAAMKVRIVRTDGGRASGWQLIAMRYGVGTVINFVPYLGMIYGLVDALFIFRESRRCIHDHIAGTMVVTA